MLFNFKVRSKAGISQLNLPHEPKIKKWKKRKTKLYVSHIPVNVFMTELLSWVKYVPCYRPKLSFSPVLSATFSFIFCNFLSQCLINTRVYTYLVAIRFNL